LTLQQRKLLVFILFTSLLSYTQISNAQTTKTTDSLVVTKIQMNLSAFGVESDGFPNIYATIDLKTDTSFCSVSYYDPKFRDNNIQTDKIRNGQY
jgi:hypothetical protein